MFNRKQEEPKQEIRQRDIHNAVRNIMFNEMGLNRDEIRQLVREEVSKTTKDVIEYHVLTDSWFKNLISTTVTGIIKDGTDDWYSDVTFKRYITNQISEHIRSMVLDQFKFNVSVEERKQNG